MLPSVVDVPRRVFDDPNEKAANSLAIFLEKQQRNGGSLCR